MYFDYNKVYVNEFDSTSETPLPGYLEQPSLSGVMDALNKHNLSDIISQLMNGWVDIEKDSWIFNLNGDKNGGPVVLMLTMMGVPLDQIRAFITDPLVTKYLQKLKQKDSPLLPLLPNYRYEYQRNEFKITELDKLLGKGVKLPDAAGIHELSSEQKLLYFSKLDKVASDLSELQRALNFDTSRNKDAFAALKKIRDYYTVLNKGIIPAYRTQLLKEKTFLSGFYEAALVGVDLGEALLPFRNNFRLNDFLVASRNSLKRPAENADKYAKQFKNDLVLAALQYSLKGLFKDNKWSVVQRKGGVAEQYEKMMKSAIGKELKQLYIVADAFVPSASRVDPNIVNLAVKNGIVKNDSINGLYEEMQRLTDDDQYPIPLDRFAPHISHAQKEQINNEVRNLFKRIVATGMIQSGISKSPISYYELIPQEAFSRTLGTQLQQLADVMKNNPLKVTKELLDKFLQRMAPNYPNLFRQSWDIYDGPRIESYRYKNYLFKEGSIQDMPSLEESKKALPANTQPDNPEEEFGGPPDCI